MKVKNKNIKIFLNAVFGPALFAWITYSIYQQITIQPDLPVALTYLREALFGTSVWKLCLVVLLMFVNWLIEARKWQVLMARLQQMSLGTSFKSILAGVSLGVNTPNRVGEYGGRMLYVYEEVRLKSLPMSVLGNISQLIITLLLGCLGLFIQKDNVYTACANYGLAYAWFEFFSGSAIVLTIVIIIFYFKLEKILNTVASIPFRNWLNKLNGLEQCSVTVLLRVLLLSALRYIVFVCQYILLLQLMHVELNITDAFWLITVLYLILAIIPSITCLN